MSGTRSPSRPEPATRAAPEALIIVAHGDCGGGGDNILARELARRVRQSGRYAEVEVGYLRCQPALEEVAARLRTPELRLYPLFLSDGYYVREVIPKRLSIAGGVDGHGHHVTIDAPLGLNPNLPRLLTRAAIAASEARGLSPGAVNLLLVAHGSRLPGRAADTARFIADRIAEDQRFASVAVSFLEEAPFFLDALQNCPRPVLVMGLFAGTGLHAAEDVLGAVQALGDPKVFAVDRLGGYADVIELICADLCPAWG